METEQKPDIIKFLLGERVYDGYWYGDQADRRAPFWWRIPLLTYIESLQKESSEQDHAILALQEENRRLKEKEMRGDRMIVDLEHKITVLKSEIAKLQTSKPAK